MNVLQEKLRPATIRFLEQMDLSCSLGERVTLCDADKIFSAGTFFKKVGEHLIIVV